MASVTGAAAFKKKQGLISVYEEESPPRLHWRAIDNINVDVKEVSVPLDQVTALQATPASSEKAALKVVAGDRKHVFSFNSRELMDTIKGVLQQNIARKRPGAADEGPDRSGSSQGTPAPQTQVVNDEFLLNLLDAKKLLKNLQLQQRLLKENKALMNTFREAVMNNGLDPQEFWNTRIHLLRSYAIQHNQKRGSYNVLSTIKPVATSDNEVNVSVTREKIHSIFEQYPVVRKIYNDNVPKRFGESVFWSRFFSSKLFRKLRGEKNYNNAKVDSIFDKYLFVDPDWDGGANEDGDGGDDGPGAALDGGLQAHHVSKFIDLTGNELDVSDRMGNGPDFTMKFDSRNADMVSILKSMNRLSKKMVSQEALEDTREREADEDLELTDLEDKDTPEYNELKINNNVNVATEMDIAKIDRAQFLQFLAESAFEDALRLDDVVSSPDAKRAIVEANKEIALLIRTNAKQSRQSWQTAVFSQDDAASTVQAAQAQAQAPAAAAEDSAAQLAAQQAGFVEEEDSPLAPDTLEALRLCHSTSVEFLRHFWLNLQDSAAADKLVRSLYRGLQKSMARIDSIVSAIAGAEEASHARDVMNPLSTSLQFAIDYYEGLDNDLKHK